MPILKEQELLAFQDELQKTAANWRSLLGGVGAGAGVGSLVGGVAGAAHGLSTRSPEEGRLSSALRGASRGVGVGAGLGALGGAGLSHLKPEMVEKLVSSDGALGSGARFGQRQVHALTGWQPKGGLEAIRGGAYDARKELMHAKGKDVAQAGKSLSSIEKAQEMGLTNLPGYAKAIKREGLGKVLKTDMASQWHSGGIKTKALGVGLPLATLAMDASRKETPGGAGRGEVLGGSIGGTLGAAVGAAMPISGQIALGGALGTAGKYVGRGVDRLRGRKPPATGAPPLPEQSTGPHVPTERSMSASAMGQPPEGLNS